MRIYTIHTQTHSQTLAHTHAPNTIHMSYALGYTEAHATTPTHALGHTWDVEIRKAVAKQSDGNEYAYNNCIIYGHSPTVTVLHPRRQP